MIVEWRALAREDRSNLFDFIAADNPTAALELDDRIERLTDALLDHPELYRAGRVRGTREMVLTPNYLLVYRVRKRAGVVEIMRIVGARQRNLRGVSDA
ncbi:type II toxin-antitoxin system RelE/ParE family toxin [Burkholderia pseudomallei]|uniref:type II toxin-antitoxin system RelE/ParE family toxin n=1 Tax=Burkholderia pseudomallei TaxID=28450 RepID=UPI00097740E8|nr:type II toxin-antitoxin system RelE/ParE family toxin [Burkholderia pseudomallei]MBF3898955.1 type II toxin-antitoxin system RelE/ParE family toxin [Burkholderia pseudomallei]MBF4021235.1 type II toxin-antitoxin system RelE/ParE family toxin [Burkholderia pseudomallei]OMQ54912.1 addiction module antitoxin [Burkholderia pseudomallei]CAJ6801931.1 addiction module antitoxin [Burkholderia pseudomallei]